MSTGAFQERRRLGVMVLPYTLDQMDPVEPRVTAHARRGRCCGTVAYAYGIARHAAS